MKALIFDLETTGTDKSKDRVIEFGAVLIDWDTLRSLPALTIKSQLIIDAAEKVVKEFFLPDDGTEVSIGAYAKHRLSRETLKDCPSFKTFVPKCLKLFNEADIIITYNGMQFDVPMLSAELRRYGAEIDWDSKRFYDAFKTETARNSNKLEGVFERRLGTSMQNAGLEAHGALSDVLATAMVFNAQNYEAEQDEALYVTDDGFLTIDDWEGRDTVCVNVGKYHGIALREIIKSDPGYIQWVLGASFSPRTKAIIRKAIEKFGLELRSA